jgi:hypothetical protein
MMGLWCQGEILPGCPRYQKHTPLILPVVSCIKRLLSILSIHYRPPVQVRVYCFVPMTFTPGTRSSNAQVDRIYTEPLLRLQGPNSDRPFFERIPPKSSNKFDVTPKSMHGRRFRQRSKPNMTVLARFKVVYGPWVTLSAIAWVRLLSAGPEAELTTDTMGKWLK